MPNMVLVEKVHPTMVRRIRVMEVRRGGHSPIALTSTQPVHSRLAPLRCDHVASHARVTQMRSHRLAASPYAAFLVFFVAPSMLPVASAYVTMSRDDAHSLRPDTEPSEVAQLNTKLYQPVIAQSAKVWSPSHSVHPPYAHRCALYCALRDHLDCSRAFAHYVCCHLAHDPRSSRRHLIRWAMRSARHRQSRLPRRLTSMEPPFKQSCSTRSGACTKARTVYQWRGWRRCQRRCAPGRTRHVVSAHVRRSPWYVSSLTPLSRLTF